MKLKFTVSNWILCCIVCRYWLGGKTLEVVTVVTAAKPAINSPCRAPISPVNSAGLCNMLLWQAQSPTEILDALTYFVTMVTNEEGVYLRK